MLMVAEKVPTTSETVPIISIYLTIVMSFTSFSVIMAVFVTNLNEKTRHHFSNQNRMPKIMRDIFFKRLGKILGIKKEARNLLKKMIKLNKHKENKWILNDMDDFYLTTKNNSKGINKCHLEKTIQMNLELMSDYFSYEYALAALILDRIFFCLYGTFIVLSYILTLFVFPFLIQPQSKISLHNIP